MFPSITAFYAGLLGLILFALSMLVTVGRGRFGVNNGDGGVEAMRQLIRAHANFAEYVPLCLLLIALLEAGGQNPTTIRFLLVVLVIARLIHPVGMVIKHSKPLIMLFRGLGAAATWIVLLVAAILLLVRH